MILVHLQPQETFLRMKIAAVNHGGHNEIQSN